MKEPLIIGIAGGTASGKTTVARKVHEALNPGRCAFIDQDAYYKNLEHLTLEERREVNFDHPDAFDTDLLVDHLKALRAGESIEKPVYNFVTSTREPHTMTVASAPLVLIEGILVLHIEAIRKELDVKIFVETEDDVRIIRRLTRDIKERGRDFDHVVAQYFRHVRPMHYGFVEPSKRHADIIVPHGGNNDTAINMIASALRSRLQKNDAKS